MTERLGWMLLGMALGFVLGYVVASLNELKEEVDEIKDEVDEIDEIVKKGDGGTARLRKNRQEGGFMRHPLIADVAYLFALGIILLGLWQLYQNNSKIEQMSECNTEYLTSQAEFLSVLLADPPATDRQEREALREYFDLLTAYANTDKEPSAEELEKYDISDKFKTCLMNEEEVDS